MSVLIKKAVEQAWEHHQIAYKSLESMSDNIHDIKLYLDENRKDLPTKGEVSINELFVLTESCINSFEKSGDEMHNTNEWLLAIKSS